MRNINTKAYWDNRFSTQLGYSDWEMCNGQKQTKDFMKGILAHIPKPLKKDMSNSTILDVGCAIGDGTDLLSEKLSNDKVEGYDFSEKGLLLARKKYSNITFIDKITKIYDYVICSNMLQCIDDYDSYIKELLSNTRKCLLILVPLGESGIGKEHYNVFQVKDFPTNLEGFYRRAIKTIEVDSWAYKQILIRYERVG